MPLIGTPSLHWNEMEKRYAIPHNTIKIVNHLEANPMAFGGAILLINTIIDSLASTKTKTESISLAKTVYPHVSVEIGLFRSIEKRTR